jgi:hypothetical protein
VHRQLTAAIGHANDQTGPPAPVRSEPGGTRVVPVDELPARDWLQATAAQCNRRKAEAKRASDACDRVFFTLLVDRTEPGALALGGRLRDDEKRQQPALRNRSGSGSSGGGGAASSASVSIPFGAGGAYRTSAVVVEIGEHAFDLILPEFGLEQRLFVDDITGAHSSRATGTAAGRHAANAVPGPGDRKAAAHAQPQRGTAPWTPYAPVFCGLIGVAAMPAVQRVCRCLACWT